MHSRNLVKILIPLTFSIFFVNFLATKFYWYYSIWYFDIPMHFLGGFAIGILFIWALSNIGLVHKSTSKLILKIMFGVLLVGIGWEVFEFSANNYFVKNLFLINKLDSVSDIFFDLAGGMVAALLFIKRIVDHPLPPPK